MKGSELYLRSALLIAVLSVLGCVTSSPSPSTSTVFQDPLLVSTACGEFIGPPRFAGRLVYQTADGRQEPISNAQFWRGIGPESLSDGSLHLEAVDLLDDGQFSGRVSIATSTTTWTHSGSITKTKGWVEDVVFQVRAIGCDPLVVHFGMSWQAKDLVMRCPGRIAVGNEGS